MTKFDLDTLKSLCKSMFDHWRKAAKTETNRNGHRDYATRSAATTGAPGK